MPPTVNLSKVKTLWAGCFNCDPRAVEGGGAAEGVDEEGVGEVVDAGAGVLLGDLQLNAEAIVAPAVRDADDASHYFVRRFERYRNRADARFHEHGLA